MKILGYPTRHRFPLYSTVFNNIICKFYCFNSIKQLNLSGIVMVSGNRSSALFDTVTSDKIIFSHIYNIFLLKTPHSQN